MSWWDFRGEDEESEDKDEEEKKLDALGSDIDSEEEENTYYLGLIEKLKESKLYQTSKEIFPEYLSLQVACQG